MYYEILSNWQMSNRWESNWLPFRFSETGNDFNLRVAESIEFCWNGTETTSAQIKFIVSNNQKSFKILKEITIATQSNREDSYFLAIFFPFYEYFKIIYEPNGTQNGELTIGLLFR